MKFLVILVCFLTINSVAFSQSQTYAKPSIKRISNNDSIFFKVQILIEAYSRTEIITVRKIDSLYFADVDVQSSRAEDNFKTSALLLNNSQIETLAKFENSVYSRNICHNQGLRIAGRLGRYFIFFGADKFEFECRELYGLFDALEIK
jgi:hypothetical protein